MAAGVKFELISPFTVMKLEVEVPKVTLPCIVVLEPSVVVPLTLSVPVIL